MINFSDIEPNNVQQAVTYYLQCSAEGSWTPDRAQAVLMLQDDPDALILAIAKINGR